MTFLPHPEVVAFDSAEALDEALDQIPSGPGVFLVDVHRGDPYLGRTAVLKRRLKRLLRPPDPSATRSVRLREIARGISFWPTASRLESTLIFYDLARHHFPDSYPKLLKLRAPVFLKLLLADEFPRTQITTRLTGSHGVYLGPFRSRASAELFDHELLSLFQIRRCPEDLQPSPDHPGCIYGEMSMCLRPCQQAVGPEEYASEVSRLSDFLIFNGRHLRQAAESARDRLSADLEFEGAAREHKRIERIDQVLKLRDDLVAPLTALNGVAVLKSTTAGEVRLCFLLAGAWQPFQTFSVALTDRSVSMDRQLKDLVAGVLAAPVASDSLSEHVAILTRWFYSSWRDGEWISFPSPDKLSYRKLVSAISRVAG